MLILVNLFAIVGQQWTEDNQVGKVVDGKADFEGNGVFSKLLLDVSVVYLYIDIIFELTFLPVQMIIFQSFHLSAWWL